jgi:hypothetical protein
VALHFGVYGGQTLRNVTQVLSVRLQPLTNIFMLT